MTQIPETDEDLYGEEKSTQKSLHEFVCFRLGDAWYGVPVMAVREVVEFTCLTPLPSSPPFVLGIFSLRGNIVSVTDLRPVLGATAPAAVFLKSSRLVVIETGRFETAFLVDEVLQVIGFSEETLEPPLATVGAGSEETVEYLAHLEDKLIALLNMDKLLDRLMLDETRSATITKERAVR